MDFELNEEQVAVKEVARDFLRDRWSAERMRQALDAPPALIPAPLWREIAEMGWIGVACDEAAGGGGQDVVTAAILAEESGRALLPGPLLSSLAAARAIDRSGDDGLRHSLLPDVFGGRKRITLAVEEPNGDWGPTTVALEAHYDDGWSLSGTKILVPDAEGADLLLVAARTPSGVGLLGVPADAPGLSITPMRRLDAQSIAELVLDRVQLPADALLGGAERAEATLRGSYEFWTLLQSADLLGGAEAVLEMTTTYAGDRVQFGRPIGSFQAVSHRLADVFVNVEIGRSLVYAACLALDEERVDATALVSAAKAWTSDVAVSAAEAAVQLHGGVGFTWELDVHLYLRRARANAVTLGDAGFHRDRVAAYLDEAFATGEE